MYNNKSTLMLLFKEDFQTVFCFVKTIVRTTCAEYMQTREDYIIYTLKLMYYTCMVYKVLKGSILCFWHVIS